MHRFALLGVVIPAIAFTAAVAAQDQAAAGGIGTAARQNNAARQADQNILRIDDRATFTVKQVDRDTVYLDGGMNRGLALGMTLIIRRSGRYTTASGDEVTANIIVAVLEATSVSSTSAMCQIRARNQEIRRGDTAWISSRDRRKQNTPAATGSPQPSIGPASPQVPPGVYWTTPDQKQSGVAAAPGLSMAERAQMATGNPASQPAPAGASGMNTSGSATSDTTASARLAPLPPLNVPVANTSNGQANTQVSASEPALSMADRARQSRANHEARERAAQSASAQPQPGPATTASSTSGSSTGNSAPSIPPSSGTIPATDTTATGALPGSPGVNTQSQSLPASANDVQRPSSANLEVATASKPPSSAVNATSVSLASAQPAAPSAKPALAPPPAAASPVTTIAPPVGAANASNSVIASASAPSALPNTSGPATSPSSGVMTASMGKMPPVGTVAADAIPMPQAAGPTLPANVKTSFKIKYVAEDAVYIEGGKDAGLVEGMTLDVERPGAPGAAAIDAGKSIAEVAVVSVSNTSAVCEIRSKTMDLQRGDIALLSQADLDKLAQATTLGPSRKYPQVIAFSEGDPLDEEQREAVPKPPLPEVNRARGRIGLDYTYINSSGATALNTSQIGGVIRIDMTRIGGTYWNLNGYWRGRMNALTSSSSSQPQSVYDLVNRTYTLGLTYVNPGSSWTAGVGRLFLPWATSLDTFDGGYLGKRFGRHTIIGAFAGTSPDPTSFNYNPDLRTAGSFVAFEAGSFDSLRFTSTEGIAVSGTGWRENRQFIFNETGLFYKRFLSIYNATQADKQHLPTGGIEQGLARSFSTLRLQPAKFLSFDVNHNYFRDVPTFSTALISTGLLDKYLFQGVSAGVRLELPQHIALYSNFGQSNRSGDASNSLNQLYGVTLGRLWFTGIRADVRYSKFSSSFGTGNYRAITLSRSFKDILRLEVNGGKQVFMSSLAVPSDYKLLGSTVDLNFGSHYFLETAFNVQHGLQQSYNQWITTMGYRFDTKRGK